MEKLTEFTHDQILFVDESAANERTMDRKYGWAPTGSPAQLVAPLKRSKKWSILPVYTSEGFIDYEIIHGSYNAVLFKNFLVERVFPNCTPFPGPRSVLIMDNARIHHDNEIRPMCGAAGVRLEYLPPYSPDLNPIEEAFAGLKAWYKKNYKLAENILFADFLALGIGQLKTNARGHFCRSMIDVPLQDDGNNEDYEED